jgi:transcriptional regulator CtsR
MNNAQYSFRERSIEIFRALACLLVLAFLNCTVWGPLLRAQGLTPATPARENVYSGGRLVAVEEAGLAIPAAPSSLSATAVSGTQINLSWTDNSNNETGFKIERKTGSGGTYAQITTVGANIISYSDTGLSASTTYYYRVRATNSVGDSAYSNEAYATTLATIPSAPSNLAASAVSSSQINLTWTDNSSNETGFKIERKTGSGGTYAQIATVGANVTSYSNTGLSASTTYYYRVRATNSGGDSAYSNEAYATTQAAQTIPTAPSGLAATKASTSQINLSWTDNSNNETGFKIERKLGAGGTYAQITTVGANVVSYSDTALSNGTVYYYRVRAYNGMGDSGYSNEANACTGTLSGSGTYDSSSANLVYTGTWSNSTAYPLSYGSSLMYSTTTNDTATFSFSGDSVTYVFTEDTYRGIVNIKIDGVDRGNLDLYSPIRYIWQVAKTYSGLGSGNHTLQLTITGTKNGASGSPLIDVDAMIVGIATVGSGTYDERNSQVKWIGTWSQSTYAGAYNNTLTYTTTAQYAATFTFTGTQVTYKYSKHSQRGIVKVTIDGIDKGTIDLYSATLLLQQSTTYSSLGSGIHTIHLMVTGTKNPSSTDVMVDVDAFQVQ